ncbi:MarR family winged helix-turn-helix transcriptional regulator [Leifsonia naganoensis]|uniref:DNA-binding MarR family transcriptional regulator n=1 Tax=Leifsonia naganoensis TaxID=150025 RepID=A0A853DVG0_9MICO|nr:MarR family winged helix-turn-helix transcriptional regulator [Leifsonia naganoensis]NYK10180.1 DNA-binding MarR family transcriptional regulator [Leifsonia naganoensis]
MDDESQAQQGSPAADVVALIESALVAVRRDQSRRRPPGPWGDAPFGRGGPHAWGPRGPWGAAGGEGGRGHADHGHADHEHGSHDHTAHEHAAHDHDHPPFGDSARPGPGRRGRDGSLGRIARIRMLEALETAEAAGSPLSISSLAQAIGVDQPRASRLVQEGVERGHVRRVPDPSDARRALIQLTSAGRAQLDEVRTHRRSAVESALAEFTPEEARTFAELFDRFVRAWPRP